MFVLLISTKCNFFKCENLGFSELYRCEHLFGIDFLYEIECQCLIIFVGAYGYKNNFLNCENLGFSEL